MTGPLAIAMTGPMLAVKGAAALVRPKEDEPLRTKVFRFIGIGMLVAAACVAGVYLFTNSRGKSFANSPTAALTIPRPITTPASPAPTTKAKAKAATRYILSAPATAGGYPMGEDPIFLATAATTAQSIIAAVAVGGGGTVAGSPVSAAYNLPTNSQVITFVGYRGTFKPASVITSMGSFGTTDNTYPGGPHGGEIACANTSATASTPSGGVCVWATATTLGVTEFFDVVGPETLTVSQYKGAADTRKLRSGVEAKA